MLGNRPSRKAHEERICAELLDAEDPGLPDDVCIDEEPQLGVRRVDDERAHLDLAEQRTKLSIDAEAPSELAERDKATAAAQRFVGRPGGDALRISPTDTLSAKLKLKPTCPLVSERSSAPLWMLVVRAGLFFINSINAYGEPQIPLDSKIGRAIKPRYVEDGARNLG